MSNLYFNALNLEVGTFERRKTIDDVEICCFSHDQHKHKFHSDNFHLNTLCDICFQTLHFLTSSQNHNSPETSNSIKQNLSQILEKLDQIQNFQNPFGQTEDLVKKVEQLHTEVSQISETVTNIKQSLQLLDAYVHSL